MEKFLKEYAEYQKKEYNNNELMKQEYKDKATERINKVLIFRKRGLITVNEAISHILTVLD